MVGMHSAPMLLRAYLTPQEFELLLGCGASMHGFDSVFGGTHFLTLPRSIHKKIEKDRSS